MEQAPFLLDVFGEAVRVLLGVGQVHDHMRPLLPLHAVHGGEGDARSIAADGQLRSQPAFEGGHVVVQRGELGDRGEIVALGAAVHAVTGRVERRDRTGEPDLVDERQHDIGGGRATRDHPLERLDVACEVGHPLGVALLVEASCETEEFDDRALLGDPVADAGVERAGGPSQRLADVVWIETARLVARGDGQSEPREHRPHRGAIEELETDPTADGDAGHRERNLGSRQHRVDAGEHGDVCGLGSRRQRRLDRGGGRRDRVDRRADRPSTRIVGGRPDRLGHPPIIVAQQAIDDLDDPSRTAVVHLEWMIAGAGEVVGEIDQPARIGAVVAVDRLIVVADAEDRTAGRGEQADEQDVCGGQVLELVDEHDAARSLGRAAGDRIGEQHEQRPMDLIVEIDRTPPIETIAVGGPHLGEALDVAVVPILCVLGPEEAEPDEAQRLDPRRDRIAVAPPGELHQIAEDAPHVGLVDRLPAPRLLLER